MKAVSTDYLESGRTRQKQRTRDQLIAAARELITAGDTPRVEEVAEAAGISRPTAYRYFASQAELLAAAFPETAAASVLPDPPPAALDERVAVVAGFVIGRVQETEPQQRAMLRLSLGEVPHELPLRQGRAIPWFVEALAPIAESIGEERRPPACVGTPRRMWHRDPRLAKRRRRTRARRSRHPPAMDGRRPREAGPRNTADMTDPCTDLGTSGSRQMSGRSAGRALVAAGDRTCSTRPLLPPLRRRSW